MNREKESKKSDILQEYIGKEVCVHLIDKNLSLPSQCFSAVLKQADFYAGVYIFYIDKDDRIFIIPFSACIICM